MILNISTKATNPVGHIPDLNQKLTADEVNNVVNTINNLRIIDIDGVLISTLTIINNLPTFTVSIDYSKLATKLASLNFICPNLADVVATNTGNGIASVSYLTNNPSAVFKYSVDGGALVLASTNPFTISGLSSAIHTIVVYAVRPDDTICTSDTTTIDMSIQQITARWSYQNTNTVPSEIAITEFSNTAKFNTGGTLIADYSSFPTSKYLMFAEPATEPEKTKYYISSLDNGTIGDTGSPWATPIIIGQYRFYITKYPTYTDTPIQFKIN